MLRKSEPRDAKNIGKVRVAAWRAAYQGFMQCDFLNSLTPENNLDELRDRLSRLNSELFVTVSEISGSVVAFFIVEAPRYKTADNTIELCALNVFPEYWRNGIGSRLIAQAIEDSHHLGFGRIELWCTAGNVPAQSTYEKMGFTKTGNKRSSSDLTGHRLDEVQYARSLDAKQ
ncbi:GNAT family N-acetyltransferase [Gilvimarinus sp. DA14]|uniref:GNAT family N-acetyltransferase n=1 Tax=Gilvimarinus sp. DA14 TaxID=2956798 RepID=UPI0020B70BE7|nr:GNAT family N-acetyltransferase [Gilvimarinus sp. DA14]UTF58678.1 GNAT family N-acetyltransferase [Gilvimarinus sp. DA14]